MGSVCARLTSMHWPRPPPPFLDSDPEALRVFFAAVQQVSAALRLGKDGKIELDKSGRWLENNS